MVHRFASDLQRRWWFWMLTNLGIYLDAVAARNIEIIIPGNQVIELGTSPTQDTAFWRIMRTFSPITIAAAYISIIQFADIKGKEHQEAIYGKYRVGNWEEARENLDRWGFAVYKPTGGSKEYLYVQTIGSGISGGGPVITRVPFGF